jgi:uncharacterized membrane protein
MTTMNLVLALLLGLGLSASTGLNTFLPLLLLGAAAKFGIADISLGDKFSWLSSDVALIVLIIASIVEIVADKFPAVDHFLDSIGTFARPIAGAVAAASVLTDGTRVASTATTFGCANPVISLLEDVLSIGLSVLAIFAPFVVPVALLLIFWMLWTIVKKIRGRNIALPA